MEMCGSSFLFTQSGSGMEHSAQGGAGGRYMTVAFERLLDRRMEVQGIVRYGQAYDISLT